MPTKPPFDQEQLDEALAALRQESDRGVVLVTIAILDEILDTRLRASLSHGSKQAITRLLAPPLGVASGFMAKADLCYCLGFIPDTVYSDMRLINRLRNECAHRWRRFVITQDIVDRYIIQLHLRRVLRAYNDVAGTLWNDHTPPRNVMVQTLAALVAWTHGFALPSAAGEADPS